MKILITGGTGFVGSFMAQRLINNGHEVSILTRDEKKTKPGSGKLSFIKGDPALPGSWQEAVRNHDVVVNLAGATIFKRWTGQYKRVIRESRVKAARNIVGAIEAYPAKPVALLNASAVGYYGFHEDEELTEDSSPGDDFLATVANDWEQEALKAKLKGARVCIMRFGIVLGPGGGALSQMIPLFKIFLGGPVGSGRQWFSWVDIRDLAEAASFLIEHPELSGPFNVCSPNPIRNRELAKAIGEALHRPSFMPAPGFVIRPILGEFGSVILKGQRVLPKRLSDSGFVFRHPDIDEALRSILTGL